MDIFRQILPIHLLLAGLCALTLGFSGVASADIRPRLNFSSVPSGIELDLVRVTTYDRNDFPDTSSGSAKPHVTVLPSDLEFFPDGSGQALLLLNTGTIAWLNTDLSILGTFQVDSANTLENFQQNEILFDNEGLLGVAFHPDFAANHILYLQLNAQPKDGIEVWRLRWDPDRLEELWADRELIFRTEKTQIATSSGHLHNHNGGNPSFGPDGMLYVLLGDGGIGGFNYDNNESQDLDSFWGKVIRIDPTGVEAPEVIAYGLRNPFTHAWRGNYLFMGDVGGDLGHHSEEINVFDVSQPFLPNFGWPILGGACTDPEAPQVNCSDFVDPILRYRKDDSSFISQDPEGIAPEPGTVNRSSIILAPVYDGGGYDGYLDNVLIYADLLQGWIRGALTSDDGRILVNRHLMHHHEPVIGFDIAPDGTLYMLAGFGGSCSIYRVELRTSDDGNDFVDTDLTLVDDPTGPFPPLLSQTGVFSELTERTPMPRAIRFEPRFPLWTDAALKERFVILPEGTQVDTSDPDDWRFPIGALFVKHFSYDVRRGATRVHQNIETRILQKVEDGWNVSTYVWRSTGEDADLSNGLPVDLALLPDDADPTSAFVYTIPGSSQCLTCHVKRVDYVIGFEAMQLDHVYLGENQMRSLEAAGVLSEIPIAPWPTVAGVNEVDQAARGYLHGNCSHCHSQEGGLGTSLGFRLRHQRTQQVIGGESVRGNGDLLIAGDHESSALFRMMRGDQDVARMPPLATVLPDPDGLARVEAWVQWLGEDPLDASMAEPTITVVEYHNVVLDHYFITLEGPEAVKIDNGGAGPGWRRTGYTFRAWHTSSGDAPAEAAAVQRFYGTPGIGPNSHFYTTVPEEAEAVRQDPGWTRERIDAFRVLMPDAFGECPLGSDPVFRMYNDGFPQKDSNHRYSIHISVVEAMAETGWIVEGIVMCAPR